VRLPGLLLGALLAASAACARAVPEEGSLGPRGDSKTITEADLTRATQLSLYDYIVAERPRWLQVGAGSRTGSAYPTLVYLDDSRLGTVETLRGISVPGVRLVRYHEASAAQQKFTGRDIGPVIQVLTK
jgi:hypothetical protein